MAFRAEAKPERRLRERPVEAWRPQRCLRGDGGRPPRLSVHRRAFPLSPLRAGGYGLPVSEPAIARFPRRGRRQATSTPGCSDGLKAASSAKPMTQRLNRDGVSEGSRKRCLLCRAAMQPPPS